MKILAKLVFIPIAAVIIIFAIANRQSVTLELWPLPFALDLPVYLAVLGALVIGLLIGGSVQWVSDHKWRKRARGGDRKAAALVSEVSSLREQANHSGETAIADQTAQTGQTPRWPLIPRLRLRSRVR